MYLIDNHYITKEWHVSIFKGVTNKYHLYYNLLGMRQYVLPTFGIDIFFRHLWHDNLRFILYEKKTPNSVF